MAQTHSVSGHEKIETSNFLMIVLIQKCNSIALTLCILVWPNMRGIM